MAVPEVDGLDPPALEAGTTLRDNVGLWPLPWLATRVLATDGARECDGLLPATEGVMFFWPPLNRAELL